MTRPIPAICAAIFLSLFLVSMAFADQDEMSTGESGATREYRPVTSIEAMDDTGGNARVFARKAEYCLKQGYIDQAIKYSEKSVEISNDPDLHIVYAQALERKLKSQTERDPALFRKCVEEWLIVMRQPGGEEDLSSHGLAIPGMGHLYHDEERAIPAKRHIIQLTGSCPKVWETDTKFLNRVANLSKESVNGRVVNTGSNSSRSKADKDSDLK